MVSEPTKNVNSQSTRTDGKIRRPSYIFGNKSSSRLAQSIGLDHFTHVIATQSVATATGAIVAIAVAMSSSLSYYTWRLVANSVPPQLLPITCFVAIVVATPIALYLVSIIHRVAEASRESAELSNDLRVAHKKVIQADAAKSHFLASTSHELRTPLNAIIGFSEIIKDQTYGRCSVPRYVEYADDIHRSGLHLLKLINEILDLSKIEDGGGHIDLDEHLDVRQVTADCVRTLSLLAKKAGLRLIGEYQGQPIWIAGNADLIRQVLTNLISNAIKFTPPGGRVTISSEIGILGEIIVRVVDTGIGMTSEQLEVALKPFGQIDSKLSREHRGTGLGLPLAKAMVEVHGGRLILESKEKGGTTVSIILPAERILNDVTELSSRVAIGI